MRGGEEVVTGLKAFIETSEDVDANEKSMAEIVLDFLDDRSFVARIKSLILELLAHYTELQEILQRGVKTTSSKKTRQLSL